MAATSLYKEGLDIFVNNVRSRVRDSKEESVLYDFLKTKGTAQEAEKSASTLSSDTGKKYGDKSIGGNVKVEKQLITTILSNIQNFINVGDFVMKKAPESVGAAWFAVSLGLTAIQNNFALYSLFGAGLADITEMMVIISHYDRLFDERSTPDFRESDMSKKLFREIANTYAGMLDFAFSVQRHLSGSGWAKLRHGFKDFFNAEAPKFQAKQNEMRSRKVKVIEASDAVFEEKTFQKFGNVQDEVRRNADTLKSFQQSSEEFHQAQLEMQEEVRRALDDIKLTTKPRTRWDWAVQNFEKNKKKLNPLGNTSTPMFDALDARLDGTCTWLLEQSAYTEWFNADRGSILCVSGSEGAGKSVVLASAIDTIDKTVDHSSCAVQYLSCGMSSSGEIDGDSPRSLTRIGNTLIYQLYELAKTDESKPTLLEQCNDVFTNPKRNKIRGHGERSNRDDDLPDLAEALLRLSAELEKQVVIVLDAVDCMTEDDQDELYETFKDLLNQTETENERGHIRILSGSRSESKSNFYEHMKTKGTVINVDDHNRQDIELHLNLELERMTSWTNRNREEARAKILQQTGPLYNYLVGVVFPFIREPYQGSLSARLEELPKRMDGKFHHALQSKAPNYLELLRGALSWSLFSARPLRVIEIMEKYNGTFLGEPGEATSENIDKRLSWTRKASELEVSQLRRAGEPFLEISNDDEFVDEEYWVRIRDLSQVQRFCIKDPEKEPVEPVNCGTLCSNCQRRIDSTPDLAFTEKDGHLDLAIACVRHLCSAKFWHLYFGWPDAELKESSDPKTAGKNSNVEQSGDVEGLATEADLQTTSGGPETASPEGDASADSSGLTADNAREQHDEEGDDTDDSIDDEDNEEFNFNRKTDLAVDDAGSSSMSKFLERFFRYEMGFWYYHTQKAETLWTREEITTNDRWLTLMKLLDHLAFECKEQFAKCQRIVFRRMEMEIEEVSAISGETWQPLNFACLLDLTSWAEHLIARGSDIHGLSSDRTPLQAAARGEVGLPLVRLLLENGADPNFQTIKRMPAFHGFFFNDPDPEMVQLFIRYGANRRIVDTYNGISVLHYLADASTKQGAFETLFTGQNSEEWPDLNAMDNFKDTPLHYLLRRREVPLGLLQAFLAKGADVNAEDADSERPLQAASAWGDISVVKIILPLVDDPNDEDKHGRTALHMAAWNGRIECVKQLLESGAKPNILDKHDRTPLLFACLNERPETASLLLDRLRRGGVSLPDINKVTKRGQTPLQQAAAKGFQDVIRGILELIRADGSPDMAALVNKADHRRGRTALHYASYRGETESVRLLLAEQCTDATIKDKGKATALQLAYSQWALSAQKSFEDIIVMLIDREPDTAVNDAELSSVAAAHGSTQILEKLHGLQAVLNRTDRYGWTPLMLAQRCGHSQAEDFLVKVDPTPMRWETATTNIELSNGNLQANFKSLGLYNCLSTEFPLPSDLKKFYFEVTVKTWEKEDDSEFPFMAIGFSTHPATAIEFVGWPPWNQAPVARSWGYHGDDGAFAASDGRIEPNPDRRYGPGSTVGCGVDFEASTIWLTRNGEEVDTDNFFHDIRGRLFPVISSQAKVELETNFGKKAFIWKEADKYRSSSG